MEGRSDIGGFLLATLDLVKTNWVAFAAFVIAITALYEGVFLAIDYSHLLGFEIDISEGSSASTASTTWIAAAATMTIYVLITSIPTYFLTRYLLNSLGARRPGGHVFSAYLVMMLVTYLGYSVAAFLFVIPMIVLLVRWSEASGYVIGERMSATSALGASWDATRGYSWHILGAGLVIYVPAMLIEFAITGYGNIEPLAGSLRSISSSLASAISGGLGTALCVAIFFFTSPNKYWAAEVFE